MPRSRSRQTSPGDPLERADRRSARCSCCWSPPVGSTHSLGPVSAIGVTVAFTAGLTLLPALLTIIRAPRLLAAPPHGRLHARGRRRGLARGRLAPPRPARSPAPGRRPGRDASCCSGSVALGLLAYEEDYSVQNFFKNPTESADRLQRVMQQGVPGRRAGARPRCWSSSERRRGFHGRGHRGRASRRCRRTFDGVATIERGRRTLDRRPGSPARRCSSATTLRGGRARGVRRCASAPIARRRPTGARAGRRRQRRAGGLQQRPPRAICA